jgi:nucleoredoxin
MSLLIDLLGPALVSRRGQVPTADALAGKTRVGLYFSGSDCHACQAFTPVLATVYRNMALGAYAGLPMRRQLEVVLVSMDRSRAAFRDSLLQTPFLALPFDQREAARELWKRYDVKRIPALIFVDERGREVARDGRRFVEEHFTDLREIWARLAPPLACSPSQAVPDKSEQEPEWP